ncbi:MAG: leucine-rich repeat domain-containing protein [Clostridia bacterium]|nr:leucine-rich repeat domain-containing protein [Clostridia bacterium]
MKTKKRIFAALLSMLLCMGAVMAVPVFASALEQNGLEVTLTADKAEYTSEEKITATLTVRNNSESAVEDVSLENVVPEGYDLADNYQTEAELETLEAGAVAELITVYEVEAVGAPKTGDSFAIALMIALAVVALTAAAIVVMFKIRNKAVNQLVSIVLCIVLAGGVFGLTPKQASAETERITVETEVTVDGEALTLVGIVKCGDGEEINNSSDGLKYEMRKEHLEYLAKDGTVVETSTINYPYFTDDSTVGNMLNDKFAKLIEEYESRDYVSGYDTAQEVFNDYGGGNSDWFDNYEIEVTFNEKGFISLMQTNIFWHWGGAHVYHNETTMTYDLKSGTECTAHDFIKGTEEQICKVLSYYCSQEKLGQPDVSIEFMNNPFVLTGEGVCFIVNVGDALPRAEIVIPYTDNTCIISAEKALEMIDGGGVSINADDFEYIIIDNSYVAITGYKGRGGNIAIPSEIEGCPVTIIEESAFEYCDVIKNVTIPDSVTTIGYYAFNCCGALISVTIPESVTTIGKAAFGGNGDNFVIYGQEGSYAEAHAHIFGITFINIDGAVDKNDFIYRVDDSDAIIIDYKGTNAVVTIPDEIKGYPVKGIYKEAFLYNSTIVSITIPNSVTEIGRCAFSDCKNLEKATIPESVISIERDVFNGCDNLTIYGVSGSYAETYAKEKGIPFVAEDSNGIHSDDDFIELIEGVYYQIDLDADGKEETVSFEIKPTDFGYDKIKITVNNNDGTTTEYVSEHGYAGDVRVAKIHENSEKKTLIVSLSSEGWYSDNRTYFVSYDNSKLSNIECYEEKYYFDEYYSGKENYLDGMFVRLDNDGVLVISERIELLGTRDGKRNYRLKDGVISVIDSEEWVFTDEFLANEWQNLKTTNKLPVVIVDGDKETNSYLPVGTEICLTKAVGNETKKVYFIASDEKTEGYIVVEENETRYFQDIAGHSASYYFEDLPYTD